MVMYYYNKTSKILHCPKTKPVKSNKWTPSHPPNPQLLIKTPQNPAKRREPARTKINHRVTLCSRQRRSGIESLRTRSDNTSSISWKTRRWRSDKLPRWPISATKTPKSSRESSNKRVATPRSHLRTNQGTSGEVTYFWVTKLTRKKHQTSIPRA